MSKFTNLLMEIIIASHTNGIKLSFGCFFVVHLDFKNWPNDNLIPFICEAIITSSSYSYS